MAYTERTADWVANKAYLAYKGKTNTPLDGTTKYQTILSLIDSVQKDWEAEPSIEWNSLYSLVDTGTVTATDTFDLDDSINYISKRQGDYVLLTNGTQTTTVQLVSPNRLYEFRDSIVCARIGRTLKFSRPFVSTDSTFGYTIKVPAIVFCDDIASSSDTVQCEDPMYIAYMVAAELSRQDVTKSGQYGNLLDKATERMEKMKSDNSGQIEEIPRYPLSEAGMTWL